MHRPSAATLSEISELIRCSAVFLPADPARTGTVAFWRSDGSGPPSAPGPVEELTVVADGTTVRTVRAFVLPVRDALPVLTRARASTDADPAAAFWGAAALVALQLAARGLLLPGLSATDHDAWRAGPLTTEDQERVRALAASMPPSAHAVPLDAAQRPLRLPVPEKLLRSFLDAVADGLPRTPAAATAAAGAAYAGGEPQLLPGQRAWAADVAAGHDAGVRISLRVELSGLTAARADEEHANERHATAPGNGAGPAFRAVLQMHSVSDPSLVADAAAGVQVHWPKELARTLTARAVVGPPDAGDGPEQASSGMPSFLSPDALLAFDWRFALGGQQLSREDLDRLAEATRPVVRLRDQWVLVDPDEARRARRARTARSPPSTRSAPC